MVKTGDRVTLVFKGTGAPELDQGVVHTVGVEVIACTMPHVPATEMVFFASIADEGVTWIDGWIRRWWPPDRQRARALLAAYALGNACIETRFPNKNARYKPHAIAAQLQANFDRIAGDMARALGDLENALRRHNR